MEWSRGHDPRSRPVFVATLSMCKGSMIRSLAREKQAQSRLANSGRPPRQSGPASLGPDFAEWPEGDRADRSAVTGCIVAPVTGSNEVDAVRTPRGRRQTVPFLKVDASLIQTTRTFERGIDVPGREGAGYDAGRPGLEDHHRIPYRRVASWSLWMTRGVENACPAGDAGLPFGSGWPRRK